MHTEETRRHRILLLAYYCDPDRGSEEARGWNHALECAKWCDTWVITRDGDNAIAIRNYLRTNGEIPGLHFEFVPFPASERGLLDPWLKWLVFERWHRRALEAARRLHEQLRFDLVHHVSGITFREPGYMWQLDIPFVWGPIGGTDNYPWRFMLEGGLLGAAGETLRNVVTIVQLRWSRRVYQAVRRASALLVASSAGQQRIQRFYGERGTLMLEAGVKQVVDSPPTAHTDRGGLKIMWSGALVPRKALSLLLRALAKLPPGVAFELHVLGEGEMEHRWRRLAKQLGIADHVEWMGWLPYREAQSHYGWADVFAFTSLRDTFGTVVLEAMSYGLPILCLDHQGVHDVVTERCGIKVPVTNPRRVVEDLSAAITRLAHDASMRADMGRAAIDRASEYLWPRLGVQMQDIYLQVLQRAQKPVQKEPPEDRCRLALSPPSLSTRRAMGETVDPGEVLAPP